MTTKVGSGVCAAVGGTRVAVGAAVGGCDGSAGVAAGGSVGLTEVAVEACGVLAGRVPEGLAVGRGVARGAVVPVEAGVGDPVTAEGCGGAVDDGVAGNATGVEVASAGKVGVPGLEGQIGRPWSLRRSRASLPVRHVRIPNTSVPATTTAIRGSHSRFMCPPFLQTVFLQRIPPEDMNASSSSPHSYVWSRCHAARCSTQRYCTINRPRLGPHVSQVDLFMVRWTQCAHRRAAGVCLSRVP